MQAFYTIRSETQLMEQLHYNLLYRWFVWLGVDEPVWVPTVFSENRERLLEAEVAHKFLAELLNHKEVRGLRSDEHFYIARGGQMIDATIVPVPKQLNSRDENDQVKAGKTPEAWEKNPAKNRQKDKDARWTKKHGKSFYGYKNHVNADARHKLIRQYDVTDASVHDSPPATFEAHVTPRCSFAFMPVEGRVYFSRKADGAGGRG
jgi:hypothetical protein